MDFKIYNLFSNVLKNINRYKFTYISIAAIIQLMLICGLWLISRIFQLALTLAGEEHLDKNNILHILTNPYSFVILNLLVLIVAFFTEKLPMKLKKKRENNKSSLPSHIFRLLNILYFLGNILAYFCS